MTTSFNLTRTQIAQRVLGQVIKIGAATAISADTDTVYQALDLRLKEAHKLGLYQRKVTNVPATFSLTSSVATASAGAGDILFPLSCTFGTMDDPVDIIGAPEYAAITDKNRIGNPEKVLWKGGSEFLFYPVPGANGTAKLLYEKIADDTSAGSAIDIDVSMIRCMIQMVRYDIADDFGVSEQTQMRWQKEALQAERDMKKLGAPRISNSPVRVDDYDAPATFSKSDWNTG